jgi:ABC-type multidrug transport system fused ATPase/permease subunit
MWFLKKNKKGAYYVSFFLFIYFFRRIVCIAHRLYTLRNMDRIIVMNKGKIVESGSHKQLLRSGGVYRKLWDMQTGGIVGE